MKLARRRASDYGVHAAQQRFADALRSGNPGAAEAAAAAAVDAGMSVASVQARVIAPSMNWIGDCWQAGAASVAEEHLATAISQGVLGKLFARALEAKPNSKERVMLAAVEGEHHVLGLRMAGDLLEGAGFEVLFLGADLPVDGLLASCREHSPAALGLTVSMALNVPSLIYAIQAVSALEPPPAIFASGRALGPALEQGLDVPVIETVESTVAAVEGLLAAPRRTAVPRELAARIPEFQSTNSSGTDAPETSAAGFSRTALFAAESAREASRHGYDLEQLAYRDPLTGLWNRRAYDDRFAELAAEPSAKVMLLTVDVDRFKAINDGFGHERGDAVLVAVGEAMLRSVRPRDFVARYGGDEFAVLLPRASAAESVAIAERIRAGVARMRDPSVTVSVGVSPARESIRATALAADRALYEAKEGGRNGVVVAA